MPSTPNIGKREHEILTAIVETYISHGEPVGSRALSRSNSEGLSAATIRNVMADLAEAGLLEQPHTSSGRVPSVAGYRYYVERLSGEARLSRDETQTIDEVFHGATDVEDFMERTSHVLSLLSHGVGVAVTAAGPRNALEHVHFQRLADRRVLAVVVTRGGLVRDRILRLQHELAQDALDLAARYINENFRGSTVEQAERELRRRIEQERGERDLLENSLAQLTLNGALSGAAQGQVFVEGAANLIERENDRARLQQILLALEEKQRIADLLASYLDVRQEAVRIVVGLEQAAPDLSNFVLIGAPVRAGAEVLGSLAVLGPTRMDYQNAKAAVSYIAGLFDRILNDAE